MINKESFRSAPMPLKALFFVVIGALYVIVFSGFVYFLWNAILPKISPLKEISYWQAMGILALSKILFSSMKFGGRNHRGRHGRKWKEKWQGMSNLDKEDMKSRWKDHCAKRETKD